MNRSILAPRGTQDFFGERAYKLHQIREIIRKIMNIYGLEEIITPMFEFTELFERSAGEYTDVVQKEMYTFEDKGGRSITLRPEGTAGVIRACIQNNLLQATLPLKLFYFVNCFRYDKPQIGRFREFSQFGVEVLGSVSAIMDAEIIGLALEIFKEFGIAEKLSLSINSIGCKECRKLGQKALLDFFEKNEKKYCAVCHERMRVNPLRVLDCKEENCAKINAKAPKITNYLCSDCNEEFKKLQYILDLNGIKYNIDDKLVRGLDYYNRTVFEFMMQKPEGDSFAVCGGGRYDSLVESLNGPKTPAFGFGLGIERLLLLLEKEKFPFKILNRCEVFIARFKEERKQEKVIQKLLKDLRKEKIITECDTMQRSLKAQFKYADKIKAKFCVVVGEEECAGDFLTVKNMENSSSMQIAQQEVVEYLKSQLGR